MAIVGMLTWWYSAGLMQALRTVSRRLAAVFDFFSIDLLLKTLFSPFRQISAGRVSGPIGVQLRAWLDKLVSRMIGAAVRSIVMLVGTVSLIIVVAVGLLYIVAWLIMPVLPLIGLTLALTGWMPWQI